MAVLKCNSCSSKVESNKCCGNQMKVEGSMLKCDSCGKTVEVNHCCGNPMHEHHEGGHSHEHKH